MAKIQIRTTIDITDTKVRRPGEGTEKQLNQYQNYTTFLQVIGLRSIFVVTDSPKFKNDYWTMEIDTDRDEVFTKDNDPVGLLKDDLDNVPVITGLDETKENKKKLIRTKGSSPNTIVTFCAK